MKSVATMLDTYEIKFLGLYGLENWKFNSYPKIMETMI